MIIYDNSKGIIYTDLRVKGWIGYAGPIHPLPI